MTNDDLDILFSDEFRRAVEANIERDPLRVALDGSVPWAAPVASQVKYLQRARVKLPSYYSARCILPARAFEQASSEAAAGRMDLSGGVALDLTCGLGVDSLALSRGFGRVVALERDPFLAAVARENFRRLGALNIEVFNIPAEDYLRDAATPAFDLIYADPDRRDAGGKKMVRLQDSSPDVVALLPAIERASPRLVVKLSPLFDVDEVFRIFGAATRVEVVSEGGECKQITADVRFASSAGPSIAAVAIGLGQIEYELSTDNIEGFNPRGKQIPHNSLPEKYRYLVIPDVALQKARLAKRYLTQHGVWIESDNGYGFATERPAGIMGRTVGIEAIEPFDPKTLKRRLKTRGIKSLDILRRDFPMSAPEIARALAIREGGIQKIAFTRAAGRLWQITLK